MPPLVDVASPFPPPHGVGSPVPPPDSTDPLHEGADAGALVPPLKAYPGGPSDLSLLTGYTSHTARQVWNRKVILLGLITFLSSVDIYYF